MYVMIRHNCPILGQIHPFMPYEISNSYQMDQSISVLMVVGGILQVYSNFTRLFGKQQWRP